MVELKRLAQHCKYGAMFHKPVCGVNDDHMQRRLLAEVELTFDKALNICQAVVESANKNVRDLHGLLMEEEGQNMKAFKGPRSVHKVYVAEKMGQQKAGV